MVSQRNSAAIPSSPLVLFIEVSSPDDRYSGLLRQPGSIGCGAGHTSGSPSHVYNSGSLNEVNKFELPD